MRINSQSLGRWARNLPALAALAVCTAARAVVVLDGTLPLHATDAGAAISPTSNVYSIPEARGFLQGSNLFHSFRTLDIEDGMTATFTASSPGISDVITRVTGANETRIDGTLRSSINGANFWLINPHGVVFGRKSGIEIGGPAGGSFAVSTADEIRFADCPSCVFSAANPAADVLTVATPSAFGFLHSDPGRIQVDGGTVRLQNRDGVDANNESVQRSHALSFVGGAIEIRGRDEIDPVALGFVSSRGGRVDLVSVASPGVVTLGDSGPEVSGASHLGDITLSHGARVSSSTVPPNGTFFTVIPPIPGSGERKVFGRPGDVFIRGGNLVVQDSVVRTDTASDDVAGRIDVQLSGDLRIEKTSLATDVGFSARTGVTGFTGGTGRGGNITIRANDIALLDGATISSTSDSQGPGGSIDVAAAGTLRVSGLDHHPAQRVPLGSAGPGNRTARSAIFNNAQGGDSAGSIRVRAATLVLDDFGAIVANTNGIADAGSIDVAAGNIRITGNGRIDASTRGSGNGGDIRVEASRSIVVDGAQSETEFSSITTLAQPQSTSTARGGTIFVRAPVIELTNGAEISARSVANAEGVAQGDAGEVVVEAADSLQLVDASIATEATSAAGGNITIRVGSLIDLLRSEITTSVRSGSASGGNILIDPQFLVIDTSRIVARADAGRGGRIDIRVTGALFLSPDSEISASAGPAGINGTVTITSPDVNVAGTLSALPASFFDGAALLRQRCAQRTEKGAGSFVVASASGITASPDAPLAAISSGVREASAPEETLAGMVLGNDLVGHTLGLVVACESGFESR